MMNPVQERAIVALRAVDGDRQKAAQLFRQWVEEDKALFEQLLHPLLDQAIWNAIRQATRTARKDAWENDCDLTIAPLPSEMSRADSVAGLEAMAETTAHSLLDSFPLPSGKWLGDATRDEMLEAITFYHKQAHGNKVKAVFLEMVLKAMGNAARVRDRVDEQRVRALRDKASAAVPPIKVKADGNTGAAA